MVPKERKRGQTALEYTVLIIIVIGAFVGIQNYMKRGIQGRWKTTVDELGDQYDPRTADTEIRHTLNSNTNTQIITMNTVTGYWTRRTDQTTSTERKSGTSTMGAY